MDQLDIEIIKLLQQDGRMSISELSKHLALSRPSVTERLKRLQENGVIGRFSAIVSPLSVGKKLLIMIELSELSISHNEFEKVIQKEKSIIECYRATGHVHYYMKAALKEMDELTQLIEKLIPYGNTKTSILWDKPVVNRIILPD
ncbi:MULTISPECIES: Lrp/AsnC family transcriptional regulator [Gracilibacillus]|uniref:Lrp/AsnC family transcriptional regulator n=1 Tax=Gracilibacillus TaxID=74385 RepID=UPI000826A563|nr:MULTISPECIES: Lrp/AsnC family transcriptional regulator [Gracilibacillus]